MSGIERLFFDTNAAIALLSGDAALLALWWQAKWAGLSVISVLEFLVWPQLDVAGREVFLQFVARLDVIDLRGEDQALLSAVVELRRSRVLKSPDAIILASARVSGATLISRDARLAKAAEEAGIGVWHE